jgi:hypothetical protein
MTTPYPEMLASLTEKSNVRSLTVGGPVDFNEVLVQAYEQIHLLSLTLISVVSLSKNVTSALL